MTSTDLQAARRRLDALAAAHAAGEVDAARYEAERETLEREIGALLATRAPAPPDGDSPAPPPTARLAPTLDEELFWEDQPDPGRPLARPPYVPPPKAADAAAPPPTRQRPSRPLVAALAVGVVAVAAFGYWRTRTPAPAIWSADAGGAAALGAEAAASAGSGAEVGLQQIAAMVDRLAERMKERPDDAQGWTMLARSYTVLGRFADSLPAYEKAAALQPKNAELLADWADAVAAARGGLGNPQSVALVERALALDPAQPKALALAGTIAFDKGDAAGAIAHWQRLLDRLPAADVDVRRQVEASIAEAREKGGLSTFVGGGAPAAAPAVVASLPGIVAPAGDGAAAAPGASGPAAGDGATSGGKPAPATATAVSGIVSLAPELAARVSPGDAVFVFARPAGGRMPVAVRRATVAELPLAFSLDDSMAMAPTMTISKASSVTVGARISRSGNALPQSGDLSGEAAAPVAPGASGIAVRIDRVVP